MTKDLRKQAEAKLALSPELLAATSPAETQRLLHELQVHQIELEMQNDELRKAQAEIEAGRARYFDLYDLAPVGYVTVGEKGLILEANLTAAALLGVNRDALVRQPLTRFMLKEDQDLYYLLRKRLSEGSGGPTGKAPSLRTCELRMLKPDGSFFWAQLDATATEGPDGAPACRVVLIDITGRKQAAEAQRETSLRLQESVRAANVGLWDWDLATHCVHYSSEWKRQIGCDDAEIGDAFEEWESRVHPEDLAPTLEVVREAITGDSLRYQAEFRFRHKDGSYRWILAQCSVLRAENGKAVRVVGSHIDLTEFRQVEEALRESETRFRLLFENLPSGVVVHAADTAVLFANPEALRLLGLTLEQMQGKVATDPAWCFLCEDGGPLALEDYPVNRVRSSGKQFEGQIIGLRRPGRTEPNWVQCSAYPQRDASGQLSQVIVAFTDITARKQAETKIEQESLLSNTIIDSIPGTFYLLDELGRYARWNTYQREVILGKPQDQVAGMSAIDTIHPEDRDFIQAKIVNVLRDGKEEAAVGRVLLHGGPAFVWMLMTGRRMMIEGRPYLVGVGTDITARKQAENVQQFLAQTSSGENIEPFFNSLARYLAQSLEMDFVCIDRLEGDGLLARTLAVWCDGHFEDNVTYALKDTPCGNVVGQQICCFPANVCQFFPRDQVLQELRADSYLGITLWSHGGQPIGLIALISRKPLAHRALAEDVLKMVSLRAGSELERMAAEESLRASEQDFRSLAESMPQIVWATRPDGWIIYFNKQWVDYTGLTLEESYGHGWNIPFHPDDKQRASDAWQRAIQHNSTYSIECRLRRADGAYHWWLIRGVPMRNACGEIVKWFGTCTNIEEIKQSEAEHARLLEQFAQAQKMESVGRLAGGVAHDFNNMLSIILGNCELVLRSMDPTQSDYLALSEIRSAALRSADLTRQLLAFARKQVIAPSVLDLNDTVSKMLTMLQRLIGESISLSWIPGTALWSVKADRSQVDQMLTNLCVNARDAIAETGTLTIETENRTLDESYGKAHAGAVPGDYVVLTVSDNGCGMDKKTQANIFEPFFTTKEMGKGTGLGLATVYGIVKQNNGYIEVRSEPDHGTTFTIFLPRYLDNASPAQTEAAAEPPARGHETILLVEDEPVLLKMVRRMLETQGYTVLAASNAEEAIRLAAANANAIHLLMSDVVMPDMNGCKMAAILRSTHPGLKLLFMSGYTADIIANQGVLDEGMNFIQKPISMDSLGLKIRAVLDE